jgi:hypothetical protein
VLPEPNKRNIRGGLAVIDHEQVFSVAAPAGVTFGDVVSLAKQQDGGFFALDADAGVFTVDIENRTAALWAPPAWTTPARATALAVDRDGRVAVATTQGVYVYSATKGVTKIIGAEVGAAWAVRFMTNGFLYAGTDQGLVRAALDSGNFETSPGPSESMPRDLWELSWGCYGTDGCACRAEKPCALGLDCSCVNGLDNCTCTTPDPCVTNPGSASCACDDSTTCQDGLTCACALGGACTCEPDPSCQDTCSCTGPDTTDGCPSGFACENGACVSQAPPTCTRDCSCTGTDARPDGCPVDYECQNGIAGPSCAYVGGSTCADDCSCTGPDTTADGCPTGYECQSGIAGSSCVESVPTSCEADCSCTGPDTTDGCPMGTTCQRPLHSPQGSCR